MVAPAQTKMRKLIRKSPWRTAAICQLKINCQKAETMEQKQASCSQDQVIIYNNSVKKERQAYFSKILLENQNNPKVFFFPEMSS